MEYLVVHALKLKGKRVEAGEVVSLTKAMATELLGNGTVMEATPETKQTLAELQALADKEAKAKAEADAKELADKEAKEAQERHDAEALAASDAKAIADALTAAAKPAGGKQ